MSDLTNVPLAELKALAYDMLVTIELSQKQLQVINEEIRQRLIIQPGTEDKPIAPPPS